MSETQGGIRIPYESMQIIRAEFTRLREENERLSSELAAAEHEIAVLNRMFVVGDGAACCPSDKTKCCGDCGSPECLALLRTEAERQLKEKAQ